MPTGTKFRRPTTPASRDHGAVQIVHSLHAGEPADEYPLNTPIHTSYATTSEIVVVDELAGMWRSRSESPTWQTVFPSLILRLCDVSAPSPSIASDLLTLSDPDAVHRTLDRLHKELKPWNDSLDQSEELYPTVEAVLPSDLASIEGLAGSSGVNEVWPHLEDD